MVEQRERDPEMRQFPRAYFAAPVYFATTGPQTIRIQVREDGLALDQIVLSSDRYLTTSPGAFKNDTTILPR